MSAKHTTRRHEPSPDNPEVVYAKDGYISIAAADSDCAPKKCSPLVVIAVAFFSFAKSIRR